MKTNDPDQPVQYLRGFVEFFKLRFKVSPGALIPRPETELLVEAVIKANPKTVLDIGTGSGNIAVSIAKNLPGVRIVATDVSPAALKVAKQNAQLHGVEDQIEFVQSDLLESVNDHSFDIIVTNLPYIPTARINYLDSSVKDYEPHVALDGGEDGFELYRKLFQQLANSHPELVSGSETEIPDRARDDNRMKYLIGEIDYTHGELAQNEAFKYFPKSQPEIKLDLAHKQRILVIKF